MPPMDIADQGRMLFAFDPTGAAFGVWQPGLHTGAQLFDEPGAMCWHEVCASSAARSCMAPSTRRTARSRWSRRAT